MLNRIVAIGIVCLLWLSMFSFVCEIDTVQGWGCQDSPYPDPGGIWEAEEARLIDSSWEEVSDSEANEGYAMMVDGSTSSSQDLRFNWTNRGRTGEVNFLVRLKVSDNQIVRKVASIVIYTGVEVDEVGPAHEHSRRDILANEFSASDTYATPQRFMIQTSIPENERVVIVVRYQPVVDATVSLYCDFVIVSTGLSGHGRIALNALELLRRDGWGLVANITESYWTDVQNGLRDADTGSAKHGALYSDVPLIDVQVDFFLPGDPKALGGFTHYFDAWDHHGLGLAEKWEELVAGTMALFGPLLVEVFQAILADALAWEQFYLWKAWQGANAAEGARRNFNRAVDAWMEGDERKAMYFLGYTLHYIEDACGPHHAAHTLFSGHKEFESDFVTNEDMKENLDYYLVDRPGRSSGALQFSGDRQDHGIYLEDLYRLSDGIYIAGDPNLVDTETEIEALRYGHITQLSNPIYQFVDFAAHEAIEWYPLVNSEGDEEIDFDNWWEIYNYIETRDLKMKTIDNQHEPFSSRLIFHFEGSDWTRLDFAGAWDNYEAIDMENWWSQNLGEVNVYEDYAMNNRVGGPYVEEGWLYGGPEPRGRESAVVIKTDVNSWGGWGDHDCDGWQLWELDVWDSVGPDDEINDPLLDPQPQYKTTAGELRTIPLLDDPLPDSEPAQRVGAVHVADLAAKLSAGLIKHFFDEVNLPRGGSPNTSLLPIPPEPLVIPPDTYTDEYGWTYARHGTDVGCTDSFILKATSYRSVWSNEEGEYILELTGNGIKRVCYKIDDESWVTNGFQYFPGFGPPEATVVLPIPLDERPHTIQYYSVNHMDDEEEVETRVVVWDQTAPTIDIRLGEPKIQVNESFNVTEETPIYLDTLDEGSETNMTRTRLYLTPYEPIPHPTIPGQWIVPPGEIPDPVFEWWRGPNTVFSLEYHVSGLPRGHWRIEVLARDRVGNIRVTEIPRIDVVPFIEGVDIAIDPQAAAVEPGSSIEYTLSLRNRYQTPQTYELTLEGLDPSWFTFPQTTIATAPDETETITLVVSPPHTGLITGTYPFTVAATLQGFPESSDNTDALLGVAYEPELPQTPEGKIAVKVHPEPIQTKADAKVMTNIQVDSGENFDDLFRVRIRVADILEQDRVDLTWFSWVSLVVYVPAQSSVTIPLMMTIPPDTPEGHSFFDVNATSLTGPRILTLPGEIWTPKTAEKHASLVVDNTPPTISSISQVPTENNVLPEDEVRIDATVSDELSGIMQVTLTYTTGNGTWFTTEMTNLEGNIWNTTMPAFPYRTNVTYVVMAQDNVENLITTETMGYEYQYQVIPEFPSSKILTLFMFFAIIGAAATKKIRWACARKNIQGECHK